MTEFAPGVLDEAWKLGATSDDALRDMVRLSAPFTHHTANRRYDDWLFCVERGTVTWVGLLSREVVPERVEVDPAQEGGDVTVACGICGDTMEWVVRERVGDEVVEVLRPCPRYRDPSLPRCDEVDRPHE